MEQLNNEPAAELRAGSRSKEEQSVDTIASACNHMQSLEKMESGYMDGALATM